MNDFTLMRINPNYLNDDVKSMKFATLMEWNNPDYIARSNVHFKTSEPVRICTVNYMMRKINSFEEFANQIEYFIDVAYDADSDFIVFPELLTTQLMSFDEQSNPAESIRKLTTYTSQYIEMFNQFAMKYNINIIGGSHFVEEGEDIYNISYLFRRMALSKTI